MMLPRIAAQLQAKLRARGCPLSVVNGPESTETVTYGRERIVIEHGDGGDRFSAVTGQRPNPVHRAVRGVNTKITIYAQSPRSGAVEPEHRARAEHILDLVLIALGDCAATSEIFNVWEPTAGGFFVAEDLEGSARWGGARYELTCTISRAVFEQNWKGEIAPEMTMGADGSGIATTTKVSVNGSGSFETV